MPEDKRLNHEELFRTMHIGLLPRQHEGHVKWYVDKAREGKKKYEEVEKLTGVPWQVVAVIHGLEASYDFRRQILNGEPWDQRSTLVPAGYGPWDSWVEAAITGFKIKTLPNKWDVGSTLYFLEGFNGYGYSNKGLISPYIYSYTNHYVSQGGGKYVRDGVFDRSAVSLQVGAAITLKGLGMWNY